MNDPLTICSLSLVNAIPNAYFFTGLVLRNMHKFYDEVSKITPNLYLTNGYSIHASGLSKLGINLVINVTKDLDFQTKNSEGAIINARVPVDDNVQANLLPYFQVQWFA